MQSSFTSANQVGLRACKPLLPFLSLSIIGIIIFVTCLILASTCSQCSGAANGRQLQCSLADNTYCCSASSIYGPQNCGTWTDCIPAEGVCNQYQIAAFISAGSTFILLTCTVFAIFDSKRKKVYAQSSYSIFKDKENDASTSHLQQPSKQYTSTLGKVVKDRQVFPFPN